MCAKMNNLTNKLVYKVKVLKVYVEYKLKYFSFRNGAIWDVHSKSMFHRVSNDA